MSKFNNIMLLAGSSNNSNLPMGFISSIAMYPLRGKPVIWWQLNNLKIQGISEVTLVLNRDDYSLIDYITKICSNVLDIKIVKVNRKKTILSSLKSALLASDLSKPTRVILGNTYLPFKFSSIEDIILTSKDIKFSQYWCLVDKNRSCEIEKFYDKKCNLSLKDKEAIVGYYTFSDSKVLLTTIIKSRLLRKTELSNALKLYNEKIKLKAQITESWYDLGHTSGLIKAKNLMFNTRTFNNINANIELGTLTKTTTKMLKLEDESNWYAKIPQELQPLVPRVFSFSKDAKNATLVQELYGYPSLSELFLAGQTNMEDWSLILEKLFKIHKLFEKYECPKEENQILWLYKDKTWDRLNELISQNEDWKKIINYDEIIINEKKYKNINSLKGNINKFCEKLAISSNMTIIHGDFCFSNILFDASNYTFKLIDPRGRLNNVQTIYGDPRYDIAKLRHSICGLYDFVVNDLFTITELKSEFTIETLTDCKCSNFNGTFDALAAKYGFDQNEIKFIEALLFLSMTPYHKDDLKRQKFFYLKSIVLLNEIFEKMGEERIYNGKEVANLS